MKGTGTKARIKQIAWIVFAAISSPVLAAYYRDTRQILGHEFCAVVDEVGPGVNRFTEGDRVAVDVVMSCAQRGFDTLCRACSAGMPGPIARPG